MGLGLLGAAWRWCWGSSRGRPSSWGGPLFQLHGGCGEAAGAAGGDLSETYCKVTLGILLVQDLVVVIVLTFVAGFGGAGSDLGGHGAPTGVGLRRDGAPWWVWRWGPPSGGFPAPSGGLPPPPRPSGLEPLAGASFLIVGGAGAMELHPWSWVRFLAGISLASSPTTRGPPPPGEPVVNFFLAVFPFVDTGGPPWIRRRPWESWRRPWSFWSFVMIGKPVILLAVIPRLGSESAPQPCRGSPYGQTSEFSFILAGLVGVGGAHRTTNSSPSSGCWGWPPWASPRGLILNSRRVYRPAPALGGAEDLPSPPRGPSGPEKAGGGARPRR